MVVVWWSGAAGSSPGPERIAGLDETICIVRFPKILRSDIKAAVSELLGLWCIYMLGQNGFGKILPLIT